MKKKLYENKKRMASQPPGSYVITTITEKEYREKVKSYEEKTTPARFKLEVKQHNLDNCGKTFRVQRKKFKKYIPRKIYEIEFKIR